MIEMVESSELFEAISHPTRIKILKILEKQPAGFASLKRQLDIDSSGNLDYHLKKLEKLVKVREDGLYALTDAGKEALRSIETIEAWKEIGKRKVKIKLFAKAPKEVSFLALLEFVVALVALAATFSRIWLVFISSLMSRPTVASHFSWLYILDPYAIVASLAFLSAFGLLQRKSWSWDLVIVQAVFAILHGFFPIDIRTLWIALVILELIALFVASRPPVRGFIGKKYDLAMPRLALLGGIIDLASGVLSLSIGSIIVSEGGLSAPSLISMLYSGLLVATGGMLILLRRYTLGGAMAIIFSLFPFPQLYIIIQILSNFIPSLVINVFVGFLMEALPIIGGILALLSRPKIRN